MQNVNVATFDDVEQGDVNNANTGQANQQENTSRAGHGSPAPSSKCGSCSQPTSGGKQKNDSDQSQIQIVPIAPQVNVQNVNVATFDDVEQGDANNANTGQANQQENTKSSETAHRSPAPSTRCGTCSPASSHDGQKNDSDQSQIQIVPIAPQKNLQNVNFLTGGDVRQGDVNNANTGQANQQENSQASSRPSYAKPAPNGYGKSSSPCDRCGSTRSGYQSNRSEQRQIQIVPIAPQHNFQNVNVLTFGDVRQGDANNANTGQANQQKNRSSSGKNQAPPCHSNCGPPKPPCNNECHPDPSPCNAECHPKPEPCGCQPPPKPCECQPAPKPCECQPAPKHEYKPAPKHCGCKPARKHRYKPAPKQREYKPAPKECGCQGRKSSGQSNKSSQKQIQFIPIAPQLNVQNFNLFTFGDVKQGNANNANTGQANQQHNSRASSRPSYAKPAPGGYGKSAPSCGCGSTQSGYQSNRSEQKQIQIVPIAPQHNVQNVNLVTGGDVRQGNANNANTGQASQQQNTLKAAPEKLGDKPNGLPV